MKAIEVKNLCFDYPDTPILHDVNFSVLPHEFIGIIGPNGGGKSTLLKLLLGFLKPLNGEIHLFGKTPQEEYPHIGYVPQSLGIDKQFPITVKEVVLSGSLSELNFWGRYPKAKQKLALSCMEEMGVLHLADIPVGNLSGGQLQRTFIARALATKPKLLLLDEPTASIDPQGEKEIFSLLKKLKSKITILMVTHDLSAAIQEVDRLLLVQGTATELSLKEVCEHFAMGLYHAPLVQPNHIIHLRKP
ncbi:MAG: metal ABC transporter ATP-binding protein [Parachlamydiaceae bacterium]